MATDVLYGDVGETVKRQMVLFFLIDQSGSMDGTKMNAVNTAMRDVLLELKSVGGSVAEIKVDALIFSKYCRWVFPSPMDIDDPNLVWKPVDAEGGSALGSALHELSKKLSYASFLLSSSAPYTSVIILMSDGHPTDEYGEALNNLKENLWFQQSIRLAVSIGHGANNSVLADFTGNSDLVLEVHASEALEKVIHFVSITSAKVACEASKPLYDNSTEVTKPSLMLREIREYKDNHPEISQHRRLLGRSDRNAQGQKA